MELKKYKGINNSHIGNSNGCSPSTFKYPSMCKIYEHLYYLEKKNVFKKF